MAMLLPALVALLSGPAHAATIQLDTGASVEGDLAVYKLDGDCQISVTDGPLTGSILIVPCARVTRFERSPAPALVVAVEAPEAATVLVAPAAASPALVAEEVEPMDVVPEPAAAPPTDAPGANSPPPEPDALPLAMPLSQAAPTAEPLASPPASPSQEPAPEPVVVAARTTTARSATARVPTATTERTRGNVDLPALPPRLERFIYGDSRSDSDDSDVYSASPPQPGGSETHHEPEEPGTLEL